MVYQLPNCPIVFPSDPAQQKRTEDAVIAWGWKQYLASPRGAADPAWLARLPMTKAAMSAMRAAEDFLARRNLADVALGGWFVAGASKRGWTTWTVGAVRCPPPGARSFTRAVCARRSSVQHALQIVCVCRRLTGCSTHCRLYVCVGG